MIHFANFCVAVLTYIVILNIVEIHTDDVIEKANNLCDKKLSSLRLDCDINRTIYETDLENAFNVRQERLYSRMLRVAEELQNGVIAEL